MTSLDHQSTPTAAVDVSSAAAAVEERPHRRALRIVGGVVVTLLMAGLVALAGASVVVPKIIDAVPLAVLSGSMEPALSPGDLIVSRPVAADDIRMGDVITFQPESGNPTLVTHRVVGVTIGSEGVTGFVTQGDANTATDEPILAEQVMGRLVYSIPLVGFVTTTSWGPQVVGAAAIGLLVYGLVTLVLPDRKSDRTNREEAHDA